MSRPEDTLPPDLYYEDTRSRSYTTSSRIKAIQSQMTHRALSLLDLDTSSYILDIGCGSGLSGEILTDEPPHHTWIGIDISSSMLAIAAVEREVDGDLLLGDMGQGLPFRPGTFDAAISISALQWLCNAESNEESEQPERRLRRFFGSLYICLRRGARAVLQFYPKNDSQRTMITKEAIKAGFGAGLLEDDGGTKNAKLFLVLTVGGGDVASIVNRLQDVEVDDHRQGGNAARNPKTKRGELKGSKAWVKKKKEHAKSKGKIVKADSKYSGRKRRPKF